MAQHRIVLDTDETRARIETLLQSSKEVCALSAYFTLPAFDWINSIAPNLNSTLVIRGRPADFLAGSTSIAALCGALKNNWDVYIHSALHAKIYVFDQVAILGSGNLTANGMNLLSSRGNLELNIETARTTEIDDLVTSIVGGASRLSSSALEEMSKYLSQIPQRTGEDDWWPPQIIPAKKRLLYCSDFPNGAFEAKGFVLERPWSTIKELLIMGRMEEAKSALMSSDAYGWLKTTLELAGRSSHFGKLTAVLHQNLYDDPLPYRSSIKGLLANLLSFVQGCNCDEIKISRPNYSQVVSLVDTTE